MTILISYFSHKGRTKKIAEVLASKLDAKLERIIPQERINLAIGVMEALITEKEAIVQCTTDLSRFETVIIATPLWAGKVPPFVNMYMELITHGEGKVFHVITEQANYETNHAVRIIQKALKEKGMQLGLSFEMIDKDVDSGKYLEITDQFAEDIRKFGRLNEDMGYISATVIA